MLARIAVDADRCQGHAVCESEAPEIFHVPKHGKVQLLMESIPPESLDAVRLAVTYCPTHAITLYTEE